jgi:hypothetical protein
VLRGRANVVLTPLAKVGMRFHGVAPSTTMALLSVAARLLPGPAEGPTLEGRQAQRRLGAVAGAVVRGLTVLGERAADRNNERVPTSQTRSAS